MKEQILKILQLNQKWIEIEKEGTPNEQIKVAEEITAHIMEFIEWFNFGNHQIVVDYESGYDYIDQESHTLMTLEELYQYWLKNIKK